MREHHKNEGPAVPFTADEISKLNEATKKAELAMQTPKPKEQPTISSNENVNIQASVKKPASSFQQLSVNSGEVNISSTAVKQPQKPQMEIQGKVSDVVIESKRVESNNVWKSDFLNKQGNIEVAILAQTSESKPKKETKSILEMAGDVGSVEITERSQAKKKEEEIEGKGSNLTSMLDKHIKASENIRVMNVPEDIFNNQISKPNIQPFKPNKDDFTLLSQEQTPGSKLNEFKGESSGVGGVTASGDAKEKESEKIEKIKIEQQKKTAEAKAQEEIMKKNSSNIKGKDANFGKGEDIENVDFNAKLDFSNATSKLDTNADTSDMQKWKNYQRASVDHGSVDVSTVKSKINTGLKVLKNIDSEFQKENDELKKKFEQLQKEKENQIKDYREMLLKMRKEKNSEEAKNQVSFIYNI